MFWGRHPKNDSECPIYYYFSSSGTTGTEASLSEISGGYKEPKKLTGFCCKLIVVRWEWEQISTTCALMGFLNL